MSKATTGIDSGDSFEIPTLDISTFLADPDSPEAHAIIPIVRSPYISLQKEGSDKDMA